MSDHVTQFCIVSHQVASAYIVGNHVESICRSRGFTFCIVSLTYLIIWLSLLHYEHDVSRCRMPWICNVSSSLYSETSPRKYTRTKTRKSQLNFVPIRHPIRQPAMIWPDTGSQPDIWSVPEPDNSPVVIADLHMVHFL